MRCPPAARRTRTGSSSAATAARRSATSEPPREVRKIVTVVFCDLTGSTALGDVTDPETLRATMRGYYDEMRTILERHGGTVEKFIGDAVMAVFGVPIAHEDDALRAVRAAWEMRAAVPALGLQARIGVNTGEVVAGEGDTLVTGDAVNVAARLEQAATPGEVLIGAETQQLVRDAVQVEPVRIEAKGKGQVDAFRLVDVDLAGRLDRAPARHAADRPPLRARAAAAGVRAHRPRAALPPLHGARRRGRRQVAARRRVPRRDRRARRHRAVSRLRRGDHVLAGDLDPQGTRRRGRSRPSRGSSKGHRRRTSCSGRCARSWRRSPPSGRSSSSSTTSSGASRRSSISSTTSPTSPAARRSSCSASHARSCSTSGPAGAAAS